VTGSLILTSTRIFTMDDGHTVVDGSVVVRDGVIERLVRRGDALPTDLPVVDVGDDPVLPGFVDPHVHLEMAATAMFGAVDCHTPPCGSVAGLLEQLSRFAHLRDARGGWLVGQGGLFAARRFAEQRLPTRHDLDKVSTTFPIAVRFGAHVTVVNSLGLELATRQGLPETGDSHVVRDDSGELTGELHELFYGLPIPSLTEAEMTSALTDTAARYLTSYGVTSIGEITNTTAGLRLLAELSGSDALPVRTRAFVWAPGTLPLDEAVRPDLRSRFPTGNPDFAVHGIKIFVDGGFSAGGAAVLRPYAGKEHRGRMAFDLGALSDLIRRADDAGLQVTAHVNGERAQRLLCEASVAARGDATGGPPVRLEHAGNVVTDLTTLDHWERAGAVPVAQAGFLWTMASFIAESLGDGARPGLFPFRTLLDRGWALASSSDGAGSELLQFNPLFNVSCAVGRTSCIAEEINPGERISVMEALAMHTSHAARALGVDETVGTLCTGKRADIVVLAADPREVPVSRISSIAVRRVLLAGRRVDHGD